MKFLKIVSLFSVLAFQAVAQSDLHEFPGRKGAYSSSSPGVGSVSAGSNLSGLLSSGEHASGSPSVQALLRANGARANAVVDALGNTYGAALSALNAPNVQGRFPNSRFDDYDDLNSRYHGQYDRVRYERILAQKIAILTGLLASRRERYYEDPDYDYYNRRFIDYPEPLSTGKSLGYLLGRSLDWLLMARSKSPGSSIERSNRKLNSSNNKNVYPRTRNLE